jgi:Flp pilus assembly protein TadD
MRRKGAARRQSLSSAELQERKEDLLRPSPWLGYSRETLAVHLMARGAYELAEGQLRRMVWLNPFEPRFAERLGRCLLAQGRTAEARKVLEEALAAHSEDPHLRETLRQAGPAAGDGSVTTP